MPASRALDQLQPVADDSSARRGEVVYRLAVAVDLARGRVRGERAPASSRARSPLGETTERPCCQPRPPALYLRRELPEARHRQLRGRRGSRRSEVRDEVGNRVVRVVADAQDDGSLRSEDRPGHLFLVERPEVLDRPAAPSEDHDVHQPGLVERPERLADALGRAIALDQRRREDDLGERVAAAHYVDYVVDDRARRRGDDADPPREAGVSALPSLVEQPLALEASAKLLKLQVEEADTGRLDEVHVELVRALRSRRSRRGRSRTPPRRSAAGRSDTGPAGGRARMRIWLVASFSVK